MATQTISQLFEQKEAEIDKEVAKRFELAKEEARQMARVEIKLLEFELKQALIPKIQRDKAVRFIRKLREKKWEEALKKAKGDFKKAELIYGEL
jgi:hypothetical protein